MRALYLPAAAAAAGAVVGGPVVRFDAGLAGALRTESVALNALTTVAVPQARNVSTSWMRVCVNLPAEVDLLPAEVDRAQPVAVKAGVMRTVTAALHAPVMRNALVASSASKT